jgi:RecB family exonuclease/inactivated superfamily I helicase
VERFEELIAETLGPAAAAGDRGAWRVQQQTRFLAAAFRGYEERVLRAGADDEHTLRQKLVDHLSSSGPRHVVVTVGDWIADPDGLFVADFDMLARLPGLDRLDIVSTEATLASGFHARLRDWLPGLDEIEGSTLLPGEARRRPHLVRPGREAEADRLWFTYRDREEELVAVARRIVAARTNESDPDLDDVAVVSKRPLPYLYLAPEAFGAVGIAWRASDAMPLAAEPSAAAVDVVLDVVESGFTRDTLVSLLRAPHLSLGSSSEVTAESIAALNRALSEHRYLGDLERLEAVPAAWGTARAGSVRAAALPALEAALAAARELAPLLAVAPASAQIARLLAFLTSHLRPLRDDDPYGSRERRARAAVADTLGRLAAAHAAHHDPPWSIAELGNAVRRWIGEQTFAAERPETGLHLLDDQAARFGDFDDVTIVGLVEGEWPEPARRNIFYPTNLLKSLGWPSEKDRRGADDARFLDLLGSARRRVRLSTFTLDDESLVTRSMQLDEVARAGLSSLVAEPQVAAPVFPDEALTAAPASLSSLDAESRDWAERRMGRPPADAPEFHGQAGPMPRRAWSVSALETYLACPFKFFAQHVLKLDEEPDDEEVMDPRRQGLLVHEVFEAFFKAWQAAGHRAITPGNLDDARAMFLVVVDEALAALPEAEAALERTRLLGSPAAAGLGEAVFRMEAERPVPVVERLLEHEISGDVEIATAGGARIVALRGKVDRLDLLTDGTFRLVDYKLGWPPSRTRALQLPIYGVSAAQRLSGYRHREWVLGEAVYLAFKGPKRVVPLFASDADRGRVLADAQERLAAVVDGIERGAFPPSPDDVFRCETCSFSSVCRLDHVDVT